MMQVFLGDQVTLMHSAEPENPTFVSGQITGIVLDKHKKVERVYVQGVDAAFWMSDGWKFVDDDEECDDD
jgi:hypothetical protein